MGFRKFSLCFLVILFSASGLFAQSDTLRTDTTGKTITTKNIEQLKDTPLKYDPRIAIRRSAMLPGWGQATNHKYWKIPIVYGALGVTGYLFFDNLRQYKASRKAYINATDGNTANDNLIPEPYYTVRTQPERIRSYRNSVRQNVDYSVLFFIAFWGLNVADAAVDAHLKTFNVNDDLSFHINAGYSPLANTNGLSLVLSIR